MVCILQTISGRGCIMPMSTAYDELEAYFGPSRLRGSKRKVVQESEDSFKDADFACDGFE